MMIREINRSTSDDAGGIEGSGSVSGSEFPVSSPIPGRHLPPAIIVNIHSGDTFYVDGFFVAIAFSGWKCGGNVKRLAFNGNLAVIGLDLGQMLTLRVDEIDRTPGCADKVDPRLVDAGV